MEVGEDEKEGGGEGGVVLINDRRLEYGVV